jgi:hypothetical protein
MENQANQEALLAAYRVPGFRARARVDSYDGKYPAFVITLDRRQKKRCAAHAARSVIAFMTNAGAARAILGAAGEKFIWTLRCAA